MGRQDVPFAQPITDGTSDPQMGGIEAIRCSSG
jgi:hypothetical protein